MNRKRILVVEDEETLCEALRFNLEEEGYEVDVACSAEEALTMELESYSLVLLDIMMGELSGTGFARIMKSKPSTAEIPIIFCTAKDAEDDVLKGFELGADDYITKPYSIRTLLARVAAVLRRSGRAGESQSADMLCYKTLALDIGRKKCMVDGCEVKLPRKEFEILATLLSKQGRIFSREELIRKIWPDEVVVLDRVVDVNITRLRQKLGAYGKNIVTRSGYGYGFME